MIVGINFTGRATDINLLNDLARKGKFPRLMKKETTSLRLAGICDSTEEREIMMIQANNGRRSVVSVPGSHGLFAIYCG